MAETSGFFDAEELVDGTYDREYVAEQFANYFKQFVSNGVFVNPTNQLKVQSNSGMTVKVLAGWAWINGYWYNNNADLILTIPANVSAETVKHGIFVQYDSGERTISVVVGSGRTTVNRTAPYYELKLAEITVAPGTSAISTADITDTRGLSSVCGFVKGVVDVIDTDDLFEQFTAIFEDWFEHMKDQLDTDAAGHLQLEIDEAVAGFMNNINVNGSKNILPATFEDYIKWTAAISDITIANNIITIHGVSWTVDDDGTLSATGTAVGGSSMISTRLKNVPDGTYTISGGPSGGSSSTYRNRYIAYFADGTNTGWVYFTDYKKVILQNCILFRFDTIIYAGYTATNHIVKPMLCLKSDYDFDPTYVPYTKTNQQLTKDTNYLVDNTEANGAVNMLPFPYYQTTHNQSNVIFTDNGDGTVSTSNTSTGIANFYCTGNSQATGLKLKAGSYKLSGNPGAANIPIQLYDFTSGSSVLIGEDTGDGHYFTLSTDSVVMVRIRIGSAGVNTDGYTFKPMISVASYDGDYVPYAKSNKQLTDAVAAIEQDTSFQNIDTYMITHKCHLTFVHSGSTRAFVKIVTYQGELLFAHSGSAWSVDPRPIVNRDPTRGQPVWTYTINGDTIDINCSIALDGFVLIGGGTGKKHNVTFTQSSTSVPQTNTFDNISLQGDIGFHLEDTKTLSTSGSLVFTFQDSRITADSEITPYSSIYGFVPSSIETSAGQCVVTFPAYSSAVSLKCRIWVRN